MVSFMFLLILLRELHFAIVLSVGQDWMPGSVRNPDFWWQSSSWYAYIVSYFVIFLIAIPIYSLIASSIYTWSLAPFRIFWLYLKNN